MPIFTARENFKPEYIEGHRQCQSCDRHLHGKEALVVRWTNKRGEQSLAVCDETCWTNYDHNYWLERAAERMWNGDRESEAIELLDMRLPKYGEQNEQSNSSKDQS